MVRVDYLLEHSHLTHIFDWKESTDHLIKENTKRPPIYTKAIALLLEDFRSNVLRSSTNGISPACNSLRESKINNFQVTSFIHKYILRLDVSVDNRVCMKIL